MSTNQSKQAPEQAQITKRLIIRTAALLLLIAGLIYAFQYYRVIGKDPDGLTKSNTAGMIAAIEYKRDGGREAVIFRPDGSVIRNEGWQEGKHDQDLAWSPDGNFLYFVSNRERNSFNVVRWSPSAGKAVIRTLGTRGKSNPTFTTEKLPDASKKALVTSGGVVFEYDPYDMSLRQVLPPPANEIVTSQAEESGGAESQFTGYYGKLGQAFRVARWMKGKSWIAAVMKRDNGEILIAQSLEPGDGGKLPPPVTITAGERIDFDISGSNGSLVYSVIGFQWPDTESIPPEFRKGNRVTVPFRHLVGVFDPEEASSGTVEQSQPKGNGPVVMSKDDKAAFLSPRFSPDGSTIVLVAGSYDASSSSITPRALATMPAQVGGAQGGKTVATGEIFEPSWSPDGNSIVFARREKGRRTIFTINSGGGSERNVSGDQGDFGFPLYSPQTQ